MVKEVDINGNNEVDFDGMSPRLLRTITVACINQIGANVRRICDGHVSEGKHKLYACAGMSLFKRCNTLGILSPSQPRACGRLASLSLCA